MEKICKHNNCENKKSSLGFCNMHYQRYIRNYPLDKVQKTLIQRILEKVNKHENGCWLWTGAKSGGDGREQFKYGYINFNKKAVRVHRIFFEISKNINLGEKHLMHKCDNSLCINPDHLEPCSHTENMKDMILKKRDLHFVGELNHSKLKEAQVLEIKEMLKNGKKIPEIAKQFNISCSTISGIKNGKKWKYLSDRSF